MRARAWVAVVALGGVLGVAPLDGQEIEDAVARTERGEVTLTFPVRAGTEVCHNGFRIGEHRTMWNYRDGSKDHCTQRVARVILTVRDGMVREIEVGPGDERAPRAAVDLGLRSGAEVAEYFLDLASDPENSRVAEEALMPAFLTEGGRAWPRMIEIARDRSREEDLRSRAIFWLGQEAAQVATAEIGDIASDEDEDKDVRNAAVFALSQRPDEEGVPFLMELAVTARHSDVRRTSLFWLAQSEDPSVVDFFEAILTGGRAR